MKTISRKKAEEFIRSSNGESFRCLFIKQDGTFREMHALHGVRVDVTGEGMAYDPKKFNNLIVWDIEKKAYRSIKMENLLELRIYGEEYTVSNQ